MAPKKLNGKTLHEIINRDFKQVCSVMGWDYEQKMAEKEARNNPKQEDIKHGHSSPYGMTSEEELDELEKSNSALYSAIINWN